jgi:hypothetical protein
MLAPVPMFAAIGGTIRVAPTVYRRLVVHELLRPCARGEQIRAVGLALMGAGSIGWLSSGAIVVLAITAARLDGVEIGNAFLLLAFWTSAIPLLFGLLLWPLTAGWDLVIPASFGVLLLLSILASVSLHGISATAICCWMLALGPIGCLMTWMTYRRWLTRDVE